jgi:tetratricopeptide (TPR) repeat protein
MIPAQFVPQLNQARQLLLAQKFAQALPRYEKLTRLCPGVAVVWFEYGNAASRLRQPALAERAWRKAIDLEPRNAELIGLIGHQYQGLRRPDQARACFAQAANAQPRAIDPRISLAVLLEQNHQLGQAREAVQECLAIDPRDDQARYFMAVLDRRENLLESAERRLRDLITSEPKHPYVRYACRYELAQVLDRTDRFDEAMRWLAEAKDLVRALTDTTVLLRGYDQGAESARKFTQGLPKNILRTWAGLFPAEKREAPARLAFLGGHPRSGTTLLEQVLDAHPGVAALDEPTAFLEVLQPAFHKSKEHSSARLNVLRKLYRQALLDELGPGAVDKLLVDKNPSPTARLPIWLRVFPELRVLIALRDPRDVVLSCYFQNIPLNPTNVNFLSFERLAKHYADLMDIWLAVREWEGFAWLETRYEDTVAELEKEGRRVTEFLGLSWHEQQVRYYEKSRTKQLYSPTYQDVTRPVYTRSVARWHAYEKHLAPILPALAPYCRKFGYV